MFKYKAANTCANQIRTMDPHAQENNPQNAGVMHSHQRHENAKAPAWPEEMQV